VKEACKYQYKNSDQKKEIVVPAYLKD